MKKQNGRTKAAVLTAVTAVIIIAVYAFGSLIPTDAVSGSFLNAKRPPCFAHPFGTDTLGRDLFLRTAKGLSASISIGLSASFISAIIAGLAGFAAVLGFKYMDAAIDWLIDLVMGVPHIILMILISFALGRGQRGLLAGIAATHWCSLARLIRAEALQLRTEPYVAVSRRIGKSNGWILTHHFLPHLAPQFFIGLILMFPHAVLHEATISFLGFGLPPEQPSIGMILSESMGNIAAGMWWPAALPGLTLVLLVLLFDQLGESLRTLLDPQSAQE